MSIIPIAALLLGTIVIHLAAAEPPPRPALIDIPYSPDNPPGPSFTDDGKARQRSEGQRLLASILAAFHEGRDSVTLPPGDYRFDADYHITAHSFGLRGLHRPADRPFRILGHGATFWFDLTDRPIPHLHRMVKISDCSHISLEGVVIDSDPRGCMDARITAIDIPGNRIQVRPLPGTRRITALPASEGRFLAFKADGRNLAALYRIDNGWGPGNFIIERLAWSGDDRCWLELKTRILLGTLADDRWRAVYGAAGTLEVGDVVGILHSTANAFAIDDCERITIRDCRVHAAKAGLSESGGYGAHQWIDCWFLARPGTNQVLGGDGTMDNALMHGSIFDGRIVQRTTDDAFNNHGYWMNAEAVDDRSITFSKRLPKLLVPGHRAELFDPQRKLPLGRLTVERVQDRTVTFREPVGGRFAGATAMFLEFQNAGWVVRNSLFIDCYQRVLIQCGPGTFANNRIERVGSGLVMEAGVLGHIEGGSPDDVVIRDNIFVDAGICPANRTLAITGSGRPLSGLRFTGNVVCGSGREAFAIRLADGLVLNGNLLIDPFRGQTLLPETTATALPGFRLEQVGGATLHGNVLVRTAAQAGDGIVHHTGSTDIRERGNRILVDAQGRLVARIRALTATHDRDAAAIIATLRADFPDLVPGDGREPVRTVP